ncbi:MAG: hypothetical protein U9Q79_05855 [Candidatus Hydrogenedentes bacterium]|nr:hypothetical protein [Candidatus Hydrogenedentota bacterium]
MTFAQVVEALSRYETVLEPDENTPEWWAGAPSVCHAQDGTFYLAARMREGNSPRGSRGYEMRLLKSPDGRTFTPIHSLKREDAKLPGFERPALVQDPASGKFRLYGCANLGPGWGVFKLDDVTEPSQFDVSTRKMVLEATPGEQGFISVSGFKDPFVVHANSTLHMFVIGYDQIERPYHLASDDGECWEFVGENPILENAGWHSCYTRPACIVPLAVGYLVVYEGSHISWRDPSYNIATGLAYSPDLEDFIDLTPDEPLLKSTTPGQYHTWRYSHWLPVKDKLYVYFEAARPNNTNETRLAILDMP